MIPTAWRARQAPPGAELLVEVLAGLTKEALLASACDAVVGLHRFGVRFEQRRARHTVLVGLAGGLEKAIGLRFDPSMDVPFLRLARDGDGELSGYLSRRSDYLPSAWATDLLARWDVQDTLRESWRASGDDPDANSRLLESARLLRAALHHAARTGEPTSAIEYIADVVSAGLCRDVTGAARAITLVLRAPAEAGTADALVRAFFGGRLPDTGRAWAAAPLTEPALSALPRRAAPVMSMLVERSYGLLDDARQSGGFDSWFMALTRAAGMIRCVTYVLRWATERMPLGLRAVYGQLAELDAHYSGTVAGLRVARPPIMRGVVAHMRHMAAMFRAGGDTTGDRFAREALLIPRPLLEEDAHLPEAWQGPGCHTAPILARPPGPLDRLTPCQAVVADAADPARWHALAAHLDARGATWAARMSAAMAGTAAAQAP
ncbi:hypothetical protein ACGF0J_33945 [Nonomuraea sp. NPDC047897]|uniref:hypothetical protein n=1 Tax=Nonomuraea sp. NPDC047897 TaxID=3364346 RepID=UPI003717DD15